MHYSLNNLPVRALGLTNYRAGLTHETSSAYRYLDTDQLVARLNDPAWVIVDVRASNAFNGWAIDGEKRGGHLPGAVNIDLSWVTENMNGIKCRLEAMGILGDKALALYGATRDEAERMADLLVRRHAVDPSRVHVHRADFAAASADDAVPIEQLPGYTRLVPARWLFDTIKAGRELRVCHVSWGKGEDYAESHIPGAVHLNTDLLETPPLWKVVPGAELAKVLASLGIAWDTSVVLYAADNMAAARAAVVLRYAGVQDVRVLNGGLPAWKHARLPVETGRIEPVPVRDFGVSIPRCPELLFGIDTAHAVLADPNKVLVDVRSWKEHLGAVSGYPDITARGHIPGAVWGHGGSDAHHMEDFRNPDNTLRDVRDIARFWAASGITPQNQMVAFHCGTGWRASEAFLAAWVMGWDNIAVYDSGWYEWSVDPANPIEVGDLNGAPDGAPESALAANAWPTIRMADTALQAHVDDLADRHTQGRPGRTNAPVR